MPKLIDLSGKRYGSMTVVRRSGTDIAKGGLKMPVWECLCDCGKTFFARGTNIRNGGHKSCGCKSPSINYEDITGRRYGKLLVLGLARGFKGSQPGRYWNCICDCGNFVTVNSHYIKSGNTKSCGCSKGYSIHGMSKTRLYRIWAGMLERCYNENRHEYKYYGGKGIAVCDEWKRFETFKEWAETHGYSDSLSIDRVNVNYDYSPYNCRWVTHKTQMNNTTKTRRITYNGATKTITEWAEFLGINPCVLRTRIARGWSIEDALTRGSKPQKIHRVYISGPITDNPQYMKQFSIVHARLVENGCEVVNPAIVCESLVGLSHKQYMKICMAALECCDTIYLLNGWQNSVGAKIEAEYALFNNYTMIEEGSKDDITLNP